MSDSFQSTITDLCQQLSLDAPDDFPEIVNLQVGEQAMHITEHPSNQVLMFCCIPYADIVDSPTLFQNNMFGENVLKPILSRENQSNDWLLWNRQSLKESTPESIYQQLEQLSDYADKMLAGNFNELATVTTTRVPMITSSQFLNQHIKNTLR